MARLAWCVAIAVAIAALAPPARAEDDASRDASREAFRRGVQQDMSGNYAAARDSFLEAYRLFPHPSILLNIGVERLNTHEYLQAEDDLMKFLEEYPQAPPDDLKRAQDALNRVREHLGTFFLRVAPSGARATLDDKPLPLAPGEFVKTRTTVGAHALHVEADGFDPLDRVLQISKTVSDHVDLALAPRGTTEHAQRATEDADRSRAILGWSLVGGAGLAAGFSVFSALRAKSLADDYNTPNSGSFQDASTRSTGVTFRTLADVAGLAAIGLGVAGAYFLLVPASSPEPATAVVAGPQFVGVRGRF